MKPRLLDLFCGAGGAAVGYARAGFEVVGVDHVDQPRYPFQFARADALSYLRDLLVCSEGRCKHFDAIHAAPLWHRWTTQARGNGNAETHPDDVATARVALSEAGLPYVLEVGSLSPADAVTICGVSCGLEVIRHMRFETNWPLIVPPCSHRHGGCVDGLYVAYRPGSKPRDARGWRRPPRATRREWREAADLGWMNWHEADLASPPAYTELIGHQLLAHIRAEAVA